MLKKLIILIAAIVLVLAGFYLAKWMYVPELTVEEQVDALIERKLKSTGQWVEPSEDELRAASGEQVFKKVPEDVSIYKTTYYTFEQPFLTNLKGSKNFIQFELGVSTQYEEWVIENVERHELALRSVVLSVANDFTIDELQGKAGRERLSLEMMKAINKKLEKLERFGGVEDVYFTSFSLQ